MHKAIFQIRKLFEKVIEDYHFVDKKRISIWVSEGNYLDSRVETIIEDENINYEVQYFTSRKEEKTLTDKEIFVFLHEVSHIIILEKIRTEKGMKEVEDYINQYEKEIIYMEKRSIQEKWNEDKRQKEYKKIRFERETDLKAKEIFNRYIKIASS